MRLQHWSLQDRAINKHPDTGDYYVENSCCFYRFCSCSFVFDFKAGDKVDMQGESGINSAHETEVQTPASASLPDAPPPPPMASSTPASQTESSASK